MTENYCRCPGCGTCEASHDLRLIRGVVDQLSAEVRRLRAENERLRGTWQTIAHEVRKTFEWRASTGMKPATDTSEFASLPPSALLALERMARTALEPKP